MTWSDSEINKTTTTNTMATAAAAAHEEYLRQTAEKLIQAFEIMADSEYVSQCLETFQCSQPQYHFVAVQRPRELPAVDQVGWMRKMHGGWW